MTVKEETVRSRTEGMHGKMKQDEKEHMLKVMNYLMEGNWDEHKESVLEE